MLLLYYCCRYYYCIYIYIYIHFTDTWHMHVKHPDWMASLKSILSRWWWITIYIHAHTHLQFRTCNIPLQMQKSGLSSSCKKKKSSFARRYINMDIPFKYPNWQFVTNNIHKILFHSLSFFYRQRSFHLVTNYLLHLFYYIKWSTW